MKKPARFNARRAREENSNGLDSQTATLPGHHPATHCTNAPLTAPVEIVKLWKSRRHDIAIVVSLAPFEGQIIFDIRQHAIGSDGIMRPTQKGLAMVVRRLPEIADAITKALTVARIRRFIPAGKGDSAMRRHHRFAYGRALAGADRHGLSVSSFKIEKTHQIGRNKAPKPKQDFPRDMHAPLSTGAAGMNDDIPF